MLLVSLKTVHAQGLRLLAELEPTDYFCDAIPAM